MDALRSAWVESWTKASSSGTTASSSFLSVGAVVGCEVGDDSVGLVDGKMVGVDVEGCFEG